MATLYITEFSLAGQDGVGTPLQAANHPPIAEQTVAISASSEQSSTLNTATRVVRLCADVACSYIVGSNPTATTVKTRLPANAVEYITVGQGQSGLKIAVIENT